MTKPAKVNRQAERKRPMVWVKELVLYKSIDPVVEIRRMLFLIGLNIIQGRMSEAAEPFESGHGIGKTTVCRLIRYCFGEKTFGQTHVLEEIKHCFPDSYVGATIEIDGSDWAVLRPLGSLRRKSFALQGKNITELFEGDEKGNYEDFTASLEAATLARLSDRNVLTKGRSIDWPHILAMCSRDQESRYDVWWNWRHSRSESSPLKLDKPKVDAGICLRSVLGLLDPEERKLRAELEKLESKLPQIQSRIKDKETEPKTNINLLRTRLKEEFGVEEAAEASLEHDQLFGISYAAEERMKSLRSELAEAEEEIPKLDVQINYTSARLLELSETFGQFDAASEATVDGTDVATNDLERLRQRRAKVRQGIEEQCPYGLVTIKDCSYFKTHLANIDDELTKRTQDVSSESSERDQIAAELSAQAEKLESPVAELQRKLAELNRKKNELLETKLTINRLLSRLPSLTSDLKKWNSILQGTEPHEELESLRRDEETAEREMREAERKLEEIIGQQAERVELFGSSFNDIVQQVINEEFRGVVDVEEESVSFRINRGNSLFGEAYETLAVLLADLALLLESKAGEVCHPGFLLHDSPREADLNPRIYERLLEVAASTFQQFRDGDETPFQYIVTTTTPPSDDLITENITRHYLSSGNGSLFGMQLEADGPTLFDSLEDE